MCSSLTLQGLALLLTVLTIHLVQCDELLQVNLLYRHGDRVPIGTYKNDPNANYWGYPLGTLTKDGMRQQFLQGQRLKKRYIDDLKFINGSYNPHEIYVRSADTPRCIVSANSNLAAFYKDSTLEPNVPGWPTNWMPMPVHSVPGAQDNLLEEGSYSCLRIAALQAKREQDMIYQQYLAKNGDFLLLLSKNAGQPITTRSQIDHLHDVLKCQIAHNLTLPAWVTTDVWNHLQQLYVDTDDFVDGMAVLGASEQKELVSLRSGTLLEQFTKSMSDVVNGRPHTKFHVYSAHDSTINALLRIYHNKYQVLGKANPQYAAHLVHELWKDSNGNFYVQVLYSDNCDTDFRVITSTLDKCAQNGDHCPFETFKNGYASYIPANFWKTCENINV